MLFKREQQAKDDFAMKLKEICAALLPLACSAAFAGLPPAFTGDYDAALARATKENKTVLAIFSGSDWCPPCMALERNYLSKSEFTRAVTNDLVLLFVDRPRDKSYMTEKAKELNPRLFEKYAIRGVPTLMFLDAKGRQIGLAQRSDASPDEWGRSLVKRAKELMRVQAPAAP